MRRRGKTHSHPKPRPLTLKSPRRSESYHLLSRNINSKTYMKQVVKKTTQKYHAVDFPGGPVVKTPRFHGRGCRFDPWLGN